MSATNPFIKGGYAQNDDFVGRESTLSKLRTYLDSRAGGISLVGQQRIGKTSIAKKIYSELRNADKPAIWVDLGGKESPAHLFEEMMKKVFQLFPEQATELRKYFSTDTGTSISNDAKSYEHFCDTLKYVYENIKSEASIVVFLDEFDAIRTFDKQGGVPQQLRTLIDHCVEYNVAFVLISRRTIFALEHSMSHCSTLDGQCKKIFARPFQPAEAELMVAKLDRDLEPSQREELLEFTGYHPFILKIALADLWDTQPIGDQTIYEQTSYYEQLRDLLREDDLWTTLVQEVLWGFHDSKNAEEYGRLESYGVFATEKSRSWSVSLDRFIEQNVKDSPLNEPWAQTEIKLRRLIGDVCLKHLGENWMDTLAEKQPFKGIFQECRDRMQKAKKSLKVHFGNPLEFSYPDHLRQIIQHHWDLFKDFFKGDKREWNRKIEFLGSLRNPIAHSNADRLREDQIREFYSIISELDKVFEAAFKDEK